MSLATVVHKCARNGDNTPTQRFVSGKCRDTARKIKGENRSAPGVGELDRGLALRAVDTKDVPVKSIRTTKNPPHYRPVIAPMGVCR